MNLKNLFPLDIEEVSTETAANLVNAKLREGWSLLLVYPSPDGVGGFYAIYVLGKRRPVTDRNFTDRDLEGYDQRNG